MIKRSRLGARGVRKVSTGCLTCKTRHKKCDEARPACSACISTGWRCDFTSSCLSKTPQYAMAPPIRSLRYPSAKPLLDGEHEHMEYFQVVCAGEFSLVFELPAWENIILQGVCAEPALHHAALAIGALTNSRYHPDIRQTPQAIAFSIRHYSLAIQNLHSRLDESSQSLEVAVLASVVFSYIELLLGLDSRVDMHIQGGCAMLENLYRRPDRALEVSTQAGSNYQVGGLPTRYDLLASAMFQITAQVNLLCGFSAEHQQLMNG